MEDNIDKAVSIIHSIKKWMSFIVLILMMIIVIIAIVELGIILIGFELVETVEMYFKENVIHAEVVLLVAVIAVSRKVILLDLEKYDPIATIGLALIIIALGGCYYLIKKSYRGKNG
ncbi:MAG: phosphate-starvation-inducible PsiE family protein [Glaciecola sp.]|nr:phosphate-starvation-inducible PsiE family protein [Glaciecola sp.]MDG1468732.1 phosphate-starvation-inducible PsiE family protein [Glaciecola sp.]MDG1922705.1 phosphate-starvation-inducible PsiE family protein [Glaciecola sp.]